MVTNFQVYPLDVQTHAKTNNNIQYKCSETKQIVYDSSPIVVIDFVILFLLTSKSHLFLSAVRRVFFRWSAPSSMFAYHIKSGSKVEEKEKNVFQTILLVVKILQIVWPIGGNNSCTQSLNLCQNAWMVKKHVYVKCVRFPKRIILESHIYTNIHQ